MDAYAQFRASVNCMRATAAILLSIYLLSYAEAYQLFYVPSLVQHYQEHKAANHEITLLGFLKMHYVREQHRHDGNQHENLPFSNHHTITFLSQFSLPDVSIQDLFPSFEIDQHEVFYRSPVRTLGCISTIWQPPRFIR